MTERFELDTKAVSFTKNIYESGSRLIYNLSTKERLEISIDQKEFEKLLNSRKEAIDEGILREKMQRWVNGKLLHNNLTRDVEVRLKGVFPDHWTHSNRWSFKVKVKNNSKPFKNLNRFNLQTPETSSFMYEWVLMKALEKENLISLGIDYDLVINGKNLGPYMLQGGISDEVLKINKREQGPIVGFSKDLFLKEFKNSQRMNKLGATGSLNGVEDNFWREKIQPVQFSNNNLGKIQEKYLKEAIYLLEAFRNEEKRISEIFDVNKLIKIMVLRALLDLQSLIIEIQSFISILQPNY